MFSGALSAGVLLSLAGFSEVAPALALEASERVLFVLDRFEVKAVVAETILDEFVG